jgi:hypothetical protein
MFPTTISLDIIHVVSIINRYIEHPTELYLGASKIISSYLKRMIDYGVLYSNESSMIMCGYINSDHVGDVDEMKNTSSYVFMMGLTTISWSSKKQSIMILSITKAK